MKTRKGVIQIVGLLIIAAILVMATGLIPGVVYNMGGTAGDGNIPCQNVQVSDEKITFACSGGQGISQCEPHTLRWSWTGVYPYGSQRVPVSEQVCAEYMQTWDAANGLCHFNNLNALKPYASGTAVFSSVSMPGMVSQEISHSFPLSANVNVCGSSGGSATVSITEVWLNPARIAPDIPEPTPPVAQGMFYFVEEMLSWIKNLISTFILGSITGDELVIPGAIHTYQIDMYVDSPDHDYKDGTYQTQYAYWALVDKNGNIIEGQTTGVEVNGAYVTSATITVPMSIDQHVLVATITQIDSYYNVASEMWVHGDETILKKEAINLATEAPVIDKPMAAGLLEVIDEFISWLRGLFGF